MKAGFAGAQDRESWVGTWATAQQLTETADLPPTPPGLEDTTLRQIVRVSLGGTKIRVRISNVFGTVPLTVTAAHIADSLGAGAIAPGAAVEVTFLGLRSVTIPPGESIMSDPAAFHLRPLADVAITMHILYCSRNITGHPGSRTTSFLARGDHVSTARLPTAAATTPHWYFINGIDVVDEGAASVAIIGDSLTDGRGSTTDGNDRWPDKLAQRLLRNSRTAGRIGVLNLGIGGNRLRTDGLGPSAISRLDRDVLDSPGVRWLIVWEGINDLGTHSAAPDGLIAAYREIVRRCNARGVFVYGATLTPCGGSSYFSPAIESKRQTLNVWIRYSGVFDAVLDFDAALRDPARPDHLVAEADSGDHLHLNPTGYRMVADSVELGLFSEVRT